MSEEDERTLWCGNLSEKATEELLYELFVQAGPVQLVKIPRDNEKRQRSYAFITYGHAASVEYAIDIFEGTKLFQRPLTLHKKSKNGPNPAASPKVNFNSNQRGGQQQQHHQNQQQQQSSPGLPQELLGQFNMGDMNPAMVGQMMANMQEMIAQMNQQGPMQQQNHQGKMNHRNNRFHQQQQQQPYSRGDNNRGGGGGGSGGGGDGNQQLYSRDRNDGQLYSRDRGGRNRSGGGGGAGGNGGGGNQRRNNYQGRR